MGNKRVRGQAPPGSGEAPAFYALQSSGGWREYLNVLHVPYSLWHLSYVVLGATIAPTLHVDRLIGTLLAFFLAMGIGCHCLDELNGRPLGTNIPKRVLQGMAAASLSAASFMGIAAGLTISSSIFPFVAFGGFIAVAYNLGLWRNRFHSDFWFAFAWGAFPVLTAYWASALGLSAAAILMALGCFTLSLAQRALSTPVRTIRRKTLRVEGTMELADGSTVGLTYATLLASPERALKLLSLTTVVVAGSLLAFRL